MSPWQRKAVVAGGFVELAVTAVAARDLYRRDSSQVRGPKALWFGAFAVQPSVPSDTCSSAEVAVSRVRATESSEARDRRSRADSSGTRIVRRPDAVRRRDGGRHVRQPAPRGAGRALLEWCVVDQLTSAQTTQARTSTCESLWMKPRTTHWSARKLPASSTRSYSPAKYRALTVIWTSA